MYYRNWRNSRGCSSMGLERTYYSTVAGRRGFEMADIGVIAKRSRRIYVDGGSGWTVPLGAHALRQPAETGVFWDLDGCPIPDGLSPLSISANIKLALENIGYTGNMSIVAYSVEKQSQEQEVEFGSAQIMLIQELEHRYEPTNVMVISDNLSPKADLVSGLVILKEKENNILLAQPRGLPLRDTATSTWLWESLAIGGSPIDAHSMRPEPAPTCSVCSKRALRLANKRKKRPTKPRLKRRNPEPEE
ncbi:unnamed protein product [Microthlaspi erraticum]|uniref:NYN domain-containing protein n=1 Tax=Microthlaspi erraticum TaxID=1685480 RepID=A0A6D2KZV9_9BRAS|nr:unnamed protein product [Microthlaspi erraticum]